MIASLPIADARAGLRTDRIRFIELTRAFGSGLRGGSVPARPDERVVPATPFGRIGFAAGDVTACYIAEHIDHLPTC